MFALLLACNRGERSAAPASTSSSVPNPNAYPRARLTNALAAASASWQSLGALPACDEQLTSDTKRALCRDARRAASSRVQALSMQASHAERMRLAAEAALAAQRASEALRETGVARLLENRPPSPATSTSAAPPMASARLRTLPSASAHHKHAAPREQSDPYLDAIVAFSRVVTIALAELRGYLEFGEVPLRQAALEQVQRLAREQPQWAALRALVQEAELVEADPTLKPKLRALREKLGAP
ncbi:MAG: hypothetical protein ACOY0T_30100 [Myxococcota bacterium]